MNKVSVVIISLCFLTSCGQQRNADNYHTSDTLRNNNIINPDILFYPVFEFSPTTNAVQIGFIYQTETTSIFDTIFDEIILSDSIQYSPFVEKLKNCYYYDTTGAYKLLKNDNLEKEIKKHLLAAYYIYGTKGMTECNPKDVVFGGDECKSNILAFTIEKFDTNKYGHPLICSSQLLKLNYGKEYTTIEKQINQSLKSDYKDSMKNIVFANIDSLYFTYCDDFLWGKTLDDKSCLFPCRNIEIIQKNGKIKGYWGKGLDLFGIPCD